MNPPLPPPPWLLVSSHTKHIHIDTHTHTHTQTHSIMKVSRFQELFGGGNGDLMSSLSSDSDSSSSFEHTMSNANNYFRHSASRSKANKWMSQLDALKQKQIDRRKKEDAEYFSGVEKAFGKKAGLAMMSAFDGHGKHSSTDKMLAKLQVDNKKIAARKAEVSHETLHPKDDGVKEASALTLGGSAMPTT